MAKFAPSPHPAMSLPQGMSREQNRWARETLRLLGNTHSRDSRVVIVAGLGGEPPRGVSSPRGGSAPSPSGVPPGEERTRARKCDPVLPLAQQSGGGAGGSGGSWSEEAQAAGQLPRTAHREASGGGTRDFPGPCCPRPHKTRVLLEERGLVHAAGSGAGVHLSGAGEGGLHADPRAPRRP